MENEPAAAIYGNKNAPYLNGLIAKYARATAFTDPLPDGIPSEPHYVWMEAGTNTFSDVTFTGDSDPTAGNSTKSTAHLSTQMNAASPARHAGWARWKGSTARPAPARSARPASTRAKHDPFVFFQDMAGSPPSKIERAVRRPPPGVHLGTGAGSGDRRPVHLHRPERLQRHARRLGLPVVGDPIATGDAWLAANLPPLIDYVNAHSGVIFIVWDEPEGGSTLIPFFAIGPHVKPGYTSTVAFTHSSLVKTVEEIFGLPILPTVAGANDFADLFQPGTFP